MENAIERWLCLEGMAGRVPEWVNGDVKTIRFSNTVARELARLVTQSIDVQAEGDAEKAAAMQEALDQSFLRKSQEVIEKAIRVGGVMAKWNGSGIDYMSPDEFLVTDYDSNGSITGAVFFTSYTEGRKQYTRAEYHRFEGEQYRISNRAFVSDQPGTLGQPVSLESTRWADIEPEVAIAQLEKPLFAYLKNPYSNTIDAHSPLGVSLFSECLEELRALDIAMSALGAETEESVPVMFIDEAAVMFARDHHIQLPKFVKGMQMGVNPDTTLQQWTPTLQVESRKEGINFYLSLISYKCGFDPGYFVFNGQSISMATATQVEATERRTVNTVLSYRNLLDRPNSNGDGRVGFLHDIAYIIDAMETASGNSASIKFGAYKLYCDFADLTENREENKQFDYQLAQQGYMSKVRFLVRNLGMTEQEAQKMVDEASAERQAQAQAEGGLFEE